MTQPLYRLIAQAIGAKLNCHRNSNHEWFGRWEDLLSSIETQLLPSGSGLDVGSCIDRDTSSNEKLVIVSSVHMMNENGFYSGWQDFKVTIRPSFQGIDLKITRIGKGNRRLWSDWTDALYDQFHAVLTSEVEWHDDHVCFAAQKEPVSLSA